MEVGEVFVLADYVALGHLEEHGVAQNSHDEEDQHEQDKDVEEGVDRHHDCFEQRLEALVLAGKT